MKFGFLTDTHFSVIRNAFRTDNYHDSVLSKFRQCYKWFADNGVEFVVHGGDVFDKYRSYSFPMISEIRDVIVNSGLTTYFIWGQHDLRGYNRDSSDGSNLAFLRDICDGKLTEVTDALELENCRLVASHVDMEPIQRLEGIEKSDKPVIVIVHALLYDRGSNFGTIDVHQIRTAADVVLSGDLHCGYPQTRVNNTVFYNPGSLARTSREERLPKCCIVELSDGDVAIQEFLPECEQFPFPEKEEEIKVDEKKQDSEEYIEAFEKFKSETKDIFERLEKVGNEFGVDKKILEYIKSKNSMESER